MTAQEITLRHDQLQSAIAQMLTAQQEYFDARRRGYSIELLLPKCKMLEEAARSLFKEQNEVVKRTDLFVRTEENGMQYDSYKKFFDRVKFLLIKQLEFFTTKNLNALRVCKSVETEVRRMIAGRVKLQQQAQQSLF